MFAITVDADVAFFCREDCHHDGASNETNPRGACPCNQQRANQNNGRCLGIETGLEFKTWLERKSDRRWDENQQEGAKGFVVTKGCEDSSSGCRLVLAKLGKTKQGLCNADSDGNSGYPANGV